MRLLRSCKGVTAAALGVAALALVAGGCSSSSSSGSATASKADMASVLLRSSDVPDGWTNVGVDRSSDAQTREAASHISACRAFVEQADLQKRQLKSSGPTFKSAADASGSRNQVSNQVVGYSSEALAKAAYATYAGTQTEDCLKKMFASIAQTAADQIAQQSGVMPKVATDVQRAGVPAAGDAASAYQVTLAIKMGGQEQDMGFLIEFVRLGPYLVSYNATLYSQLPDHAGRNMVDRSIARLEAATGLSGTGA